MNTVTECAAQMPPGSPAPCPPRTFDLGETTVTLQGAALRRMTWRGEEVARGLELLVRDPHWAVLNLETLSCDIEADDQQLTLTALQRCQGEGGTLDVRLELRVNDGHLVFRASGDVSGQLVTNRAGFVLLHPLENTRGQPLTVVHTGGTVQHLDFPVYISPGQPVLDIRALTYTSTHGTSIEVSLISDAPFEMEDQRNWTDASYKTYFRPLSWPRPYTLTSNAALDQEIRLRVSATGHAPAPDVVRPFWRDAPAGRPVLGVAVGVHTGAWTPEDQDAALALHPGRIYVWTDLRSGDWSQTLSQARRLADTAGAILNIEAVLAEGQERLGLTRLAAELPGFAGELTALPEAYLRGYQPQGPWPTGVTPEEAWRMARPFFPLARLGSGSLGQFTEFNRCPPLAGADFVTHGTTALVHAADDLSVMQTLEALPDVFASALRHAGTSTYQVGPSFIGMRFDPDGAALATNPRGGRVTRTAHDPRQGALFGAAWLLGYAAQAMAAGVSGLALAEVAGPFGLRNASGLRPAFHLLGGLWARSAQRWQTRIQPSLTAIRALDGGQSVTWLANLTAEEVAVPPDCEHTAFSLLDAEHLGAAERDLNFFQRSMPGQLIRLPPYAVAQLVGGRA